MPRRNGECDCRRDSFHAASRDGREGNRRFDQTVFIVDAKGGGSDPAVALMGQILDRLTGKLA
jgi:hypothetical protein